MGVGGCHASCAASSAARWPQAGLPHHGWLAGAHAAPRSRRLQRVRRRDGQVNRGLRAARPGAEQQVGAHHLQA